MWSSGQRLAIGLVLVAGAGGQTAYLRSGIPGEVILIADATNETPIIVTTARPHGLSDGDRVYIAGVKGNSAANGTRCVASAGETTFALRDVTCTVEVAGSGAYTGGGTVGRTVAYTLREHPRIRLDGPGGPLTQALPSRAVDANNPWAALKQALNSYIIAGCPDNCYYEDATKWINGIADNSYYPGIGSWAAISSAATFWYAAANGGQATETEKQRARDAALYFLNNAEKTAEWTVGCNEARDYCGRQSGDYGSFYLGGLAAAYSLMRSEMTAGQRQTFAAKVLNSEMDPGGCANSLVAATGTVSTRQDPTNLRRVLGVGTQFTREFSPGDGLHIPAGGTARTYVVDVIETDTSLLVKTTPSDTYTNREFMRARPWQEGDCGYVWMLRHHGSSPRTMGPLTASGYNDSWGGNNRTLTKVYGYIAAGLALCGDDERACRLLEAAYAYWFDEIYKFEKEFWTGYANSDASYNYNRQFPLTFMIVSMLRNSIASPALDQTNGLWLKRAMLQPIYVTDPTRCDKILRWGGGGNQDYWTASRARTQVFGASFYPGSDEAKYALGWYKNVACDNGTTRSLWDVQSLASGHGGAAGQVLILADPSWEVLDPRNLPHQFLFRATDLDPSRQVAAVVSKTGWGSTDTWAEIVAYDKTPFDHLEWDPAQIGNHGAYRIFRNQWLLEGDGGYSTSTPLRVGDWHRSNFIAVGDPTKQYTVLKQPGSYTLGYITNFQDVEIARWAGADPTGDTGNRYAYAMVDAQNAYLASAGVSRVHRHWVHLKAPGTQDYIVVYDDIALASPNRIGTYLHYSQNYNRSGTAGEGNTVLEGDLVTSTASNARLLTKILQPAGSGTVRIYLDNPDGSYSGGTGNTFRVSLCRSSDGGQSCATSATDAEFLVVHKPDLNTAGMMPNVTLLSWGAGEVCGVQIEGPSPKVVVFSRGGSLRSSVSFTSTHEGTAQVLVAGLAAGSYEVRRNQVRILADVSVPVGDHTLYFEAPAGTFEITQTGAEAPLAMLSGSPLPQGLVGVEYSEVLRASGGREPYRWSVVSGELPEGMMLSSEGVVQGTPAAPGMYAFEVQVEDSSVPPQAVRKELMLRVESRVEPELLIRPTAVGCTGAVVHYGRAGLDANQACVLTLSEDSGLQSPIESHRDRGGPAMREYVFGAVAPLKPGTDYYVGVACGAESGIGRFSTLQGCETGVSRIKLSTQVPTYLAVERLVIEYGPTPALGSTLEVACSGWCEAEIPVSSGNLLYIRRRYRDASGQERATGSVRVVPVP